jgi:hypothetical protein
MDVQAGSGFLHVGNGVPGPPRDPGLLEPRGPVATPVPVRRPTRRGSGSSTTARVGAVGTLSRTENFRARGYLESGCSVMLMI